MYTHALAGKEKSQGPDHPSLLDTVNGLGLVHAKQNWLGDAEAMYIWALEG